MFNFIQRYRRAHHLIRENAHLRDHIIDLRAQNLRYRELKGDIPSDQQKAEFQRIVAEHSRLVAEQMEIVKWLRDHGYFDSPRGAPDFPKLIISLIQGGK